MTSQNCFSGFAQLEISCFQISLLPLAFDCKDELCVTKRECCFSGLILLSLERSSLAVFSGVQDAPSISRLY